MTRPVKLCAGASSGGHMTELASLLEQCHLWPVRPAMYVTSLSLSDLDESAGGHWFVIGECDRRRPLQAALVFLRALRIAWRERPDVVITTGSLPLALFCLSCKLFGAKIVWIDSISQVDVLSVSGRLVRPFADLFLVQWPELELRYAGVQYHGELA